MITLNKTELLNLYSMQPILVEDFYEFLNKFISRGGVINVGTEAGIEYQLKSIDELAKFRLSFES